MPNMGYCRFQNTLQDLQECEQALCDGDELSPEEEQAKQEMIKLCKHIARDYGDE